MAEDLKAVKSNALNFLVAEATIAPGTPRDVYVEVLWWFLQCLRTDSRTPESIREAADVLQEGLGES